ncbi:hypothetical protein LCGC14_1462890 [marine sediment metagenome]|uniref:Uncharacterized protein n=1 Tax=marine sediment metagenome TaxID=412755 RepID=A0A0F9MGI9_9ZZZZ
MGRTNKGRVKVVKKSAQHRRIEAAIRWYNIGVEDGARWEVAMQNDAEVTEIDEEGNIKHQRKLNILRDPEGEYADTGDEEGNE